MTVVERTSVDLVERILAAGAEQASLALVAFSNQPAGLGVDANTIPDASITASVRWLFEVKSERNAVRKGPTRGASSRLR
jgi:hypothetical protein